METFTENEKIVLEKDGKTYEYDVLFTFDSEDTMRSYVGYTDYSIGKNGRQNIYVSAINPFSTDGKLEDITDPRELAMINDVLQQIDEEANSQEVSENE